MGPQSAWAVRKTLLSQELQAFGSRMALVPVISVSRLNRGRGTFVEYEGRELAIFLLDDPERVQVIDNACPHASGNLSGGTVADGRVTCPWHEWQFDLASGVCTHSDRARVRGYPAEMRDGMVWVDFSEVYRRV